jgi:hypothetical protein
MKMPTPRSSNNQSGQPTGKRGQVYGTLIPFKGNNADSHGCYNAATGLSCRYVFNQDIPAGQDYGVYTNAITGQGGFTTEKIMVYLA